MERRAILGESGVSSSLCLHNCPSAACELLVLVIFSLRSPWRRVYWLHTIRWQGALPLQWGLNLGSKVRLCMHVCTQNCLSVSGGDWQLTRCGSRSRFPSTLTLSTSLRIGVSVCTVACWSLKHRLLGMPLISSNLQYIDETSVFQCSPTVYAVAFIPQLQAELTAG